MITFILVFLIMLLVVVAMSIGVIVGNSKIEGSCGGIANIDGLKSNCSCKNPCASQISQTSNSAKLEQKLNFHPQNSPISQPLDKK